MYGKGIQHVASTGQLGRQEFRQARCAELPVVTVIAGDPSVRQSLEAVIRSTEWDLRSFVSATAFLSQPRRFSPGCIVATTVLPDCCGLELQARLRRTEAFLSSIMILEHPDVSAVVRAMKAGAVEVLTRPIDDLALVGALGEAITRSRVKFDEYARLMELRENFGLLTNRERQVMALVVSGLLNKQVGAELGISEITVKAHRGQVMRKMGARSFADLVGKALMLARASNDAAGLAACGILSFNRESPRFGA